PGSSLATADSLALRRGGLHIRAGCRRTAVYNHEHNEDCSRSLSAVCPPQRTPNAPHAGIRSPGPGAPRGVALSRRRGREPAAGAISRRDRLQSPDSTPEPLWKEAPMGQFESWRSRFRGPLLALVLLVLYVPDGLHAQAGKLTGVVRDQTGGQPLAGVQV